MLDRNSLRENLNEIASQLATKGFELDAHEFEKLLTREKDDPQV